MMSGDDLSHYDLVQSLIVQRDRLIAERDTYHDALRFIARMNYSAPAEVASRALSKHEDRFNDEGLKYRDEYGH